jgi:glycosyltransferase involved in cell wall biosynthesis
MRLLICTQAVDRDDPALGFFHRWVEEFAAHADKIVIICLRKGNYDLPKHVEVIALGEKWRFLRALEVCSIAFGRRADYEAVFVHMNPEYLVAAGWFWRLLGKRTALWYAHKSVNLKLRIAAKLANVIFTASKESFRLQSKKVQVIGHGIDADMFSPDSSVPRGEHLLSVGRLMPSKRHDRAIRIAAEEGRELRIIGDGPERARLESLAQEIGATVSFLGPLSQKSLPDEYRRAHAFLHTSETGSLDKVVLEALACGCPIRTDDPALKYLEKENSESVRAHHSLTALIPRILQEL